MAYRPRRKPNEIPSPSKELQRPADYQPPGGRPVAPRQDPEPELEQTAKVVVPEIEIPAFTRADLESAGLLPAAEPPRKRRLSGFKLEEMRRLLAEKARRRCEPLRMYRPLPSQLAFHQSEAPERICRGSNRSGKTSCGLVELAWAVTGTHPTWDYPLENGRAFIVGANETHIGQVFFAKLCRAGAFRMVRDLESGDWRIFDPIKDADRKPRDVKPTPPLLPRRVIDHIAWKDKKNRVFKTIRLKNGWEITAFPGGGEPPQGADVDIVQFDEEIEHPDWYPEMSARLLDRCGRFWWTATPQVGTEQLWDLSERADEERRLPAPSIEEYFLTLDDNSYLEVEKKDALKKKFANNPEAYRVRIEGLFANYSFLMFPEFSPATHGVSTSENKDQGSVPYERLPRGEIPQSWCRYVVIDPGHQVCAVLFAAMPPPGMGDYVYLYDELYLRQCDAETFGRAMRDKTGGQSFYAFIIDEHGSRRTETGTGTTIKKQYTDALKKYGVRSEATGHGFISGSDDIEGRCMQVRAWMRIREDGTVKLRVLRDRLPNFLEEIKRYRRKTIKVDGQKIIKDAPDDRKWSHLQVCLQYLAAYRPKFHKPKPGEARMTSAQRRLEEKRKKHKAEGAGRYVNLGPGKNVA